MRRSIPALIVLAVCGIVTRPTLAADAMLWKALKTPGHIALIRHAVAPGTGDPAGFTIDDCNSQRNLSDSGRQQARRIGESFRAQGIYEARVYSSQWCRTLDTARLLGLGRINELPALNSFFSHAALGDERSATVRRWLYAQGDGAPLVLVTHQVNITALTGVYPRAGEIVVARKQPNGELLVLGTIVSD